MKDITNLMLRFKDAIRHNWNTYFLAGQDVMSDDVQEVYASLEEALFAAIVLIPLGIPDQARLYRKKPLSFIQVKPLENSKEFPLRVCEPQANGGIKVEMPRSVAVDEQSTCSFFDYYDWYSYGPIDLPYVRAKAVSFPLEPTLQGKIVLIEQVHCRFLLGSS